MYASPQIHDPRAEDLVEQGHPAKPVSTSPQSQWSILGEPNKLLAIRSTKCSLHFRVRQKSNERHPPLSPAAPAQPKAAASSPPSPPSP